VNPTPDVAPEALTVSELTRTLKQVVEGSSLRQVIVQGELFDVHDKPQRSGHWYFGIKDASAQIRVVLFRAQATTLARPLKNGDLVTIHGRVGVFESKGETQLYADRVQPVGKGAAREALEALYRQLKAEGVFSHPKRPLPLLPRGLAVVTSTTGAVRHDIDQVTDRRFPGLPRFVIGTAVQGPTAAQEIVAALQQAATFPVSVVILARGGGSKEDLIAFNDERVVRAVAACPYPIISAIGHGIDRSLTDLAADYEAATPSQAAEMSVPVQRELQLRHRQNSHRLEQAIEQILTLHRQRWTHLTTRPVMTDPQQLWTPHRHRLESLQERFDRLSERYWQRQHHQLAMLQQRLAGFDPLATLQRGYAYASTDLSPTATVLSATTVALHTPFVVRWHDGYAWVNAHAVHVESDSPDSPDSPTPSDPFDPFDPFERM